MIYPGWPCARCGGLMRYISNGTCIECERRRHLHRSYGITAGEHAAILASQGGVCAICSVAAGRQWVVDHDHETGKLRGILCDYCNRGLGWFGDRADVLRLAAEYIER